MPRGNATLLELSRGGGITCGLRVLACPWFAGLAAAGQIEIDHVRMTSGVPATEAMKAYRTMRTTRAPRVPFVTLQCNAPGPIEAPCRAGCGR